MIKTVRILGIDYSVIHENGDLNGSSCAGQCNNTQCTIRVCNAVNGPEHAKSVLLHEIIEALNYRLELKLDHNKITALESGLFQVIRDNTDLLTYFMRKQ